MEPGDREDQIPNHVAAAPWGRGKIWALLEREPMKSLPL